jgi:hypothetical protein
MPNTVDNAMITGLEQGMLALLGSKSAATLRKLVNPPDLALACLALVAILRAAPPRAAVLGRVSALMAQVLFSTALDAVLRGVSATQDEGLACVTLLAIFYWGSALDPNGELSTTAQYLLVASLSDKLWGSQPALLTAWATAFTPASTIPADVSGLAQLVTVETLNQWLREWMPPSLLIPSAAVLLYLCAPFAGEFPALNRLYRFAVFALANDSVFAKAPTWLVAAGLWALWLAEPDPVSKRLAAIAGRSVTVLAVLDAMRFAMDNDPAPLLIALLVAIQIATARPSVA